MKKRVKIPLNKPSELLRLAERIKERHLADGDESLLKLFNWKEFGPIIDDAIEAHQEAEQLKRAMLQAYQRRQRNVESVISLIRDSRDVLTGFYSKEMKILGRWGFDVLERRTRSASSNETI